MKWPAHLSFGAAAVTAAMAGLSLAVVDAGIRRWVLFIAIPPIAGSVVQGFQYRKGRSDNAFWPVAVYLFFIAFYLFSALGLYLFGVILQSAAWVLGRRERSRRSGDFDHAADTARPSA
jgi:hypothetical protein